MIKEFKIKDQRFRVNRLDPILAFNIWHKFTSEWDKAGNPPIDYSDEDGEMPEDFKYGKKAWDTLVDAAKIQKNVLIHINRLSVEYMEELRVQMFNVLEAEVKYQDSKEWTPINDALLEVFEPMDNFAVTEAVIRSFFTHFEGSFTANRTLFLELFGEVV